LARNIQQAGAFFGRREPGRGERNPEAHSPDRRKAAGREEREGRSGKGDAFRRGFPAGEPERWPIPGEHTAPTRRKTSGGEEGRGFPGGIKPLKRRYEALTGLVGKRRSGWGRETFLRSPGRRKALKGKAQERWELKEALEGAKAQSAERVAKPCGRRLRETG
jgi:hypothetical protein